MTWTNAWTADVGAEIARVRKAQGISQTALGEKCAALGYPIPRDTIADYESNRREAAIAHEVVVIAAALDVAPDDLLFPQATPAYVRMARALWLAEEAARVLDENTPPTR